MPTVDIILTSYNRPKGLIQAIRSVINQTKKDWFLYIVDDGSDFDISGLIKSFSDNRIRLLKFSPTPEDRLEHVRYALNINYALHLSVCPYIAYLCDDDYFFPDWLEQAVRFLEADTDDRLIVYGKLKKVDYKSVSDLNSEGKVWFIENVDNPLCKVDHCSVVHRRECLKTTYWLDRFPADASFFYELSLHFKFHSLPVFAVQKGMHGKTLINQWQARFETGLEGLRE